MTNYRYNVIKKIGHDLGEPFAQFLSLADARLFAQSKIQQDTKEGACIDYYLFDDIELLEEIHGIPVTDTTEPEKKHHTVFNPTPLPTVPKPPGVLEDFLIEKDDDDSSND